MIFFKEHSMTEENVTPISEIPSIERGSISLYPVVAKFERKIKNRTFCCYPGLRQKSGHSVQFLFQGGQKAHRNVHFAGGTLGKDLLPSQLCRVTFTQIPLPLDLEDRVPVPLR